MWESQSEGADIPRTTRADSHAQPTAANPDGPAISGGSCLRLSPLAEEMVSQSYADWMSDLLVVQYTESRSLSHTGESQRACARSSIDSDKAVFFAAMVG